MRKRILALYILLVAVYLLLTIMLNADDTAEVRFDLSTSQVNLLRATIVLPLIAIWGLAFYSYSQVRQYADTIQRQKEGPAFRDISRGMLSLALWLPVNSLVSSGSNYIYENLPNLTVPTVIIGNYIHIIVLFAAFFYIHSGVKSLASRTKKLDSWSQSKWIQPLFLVLGSVYIYLSLTNPVRRAPSESVEVATSYLPDFLLITTVLIPYLIIFYLGIMSVQYLHSYRISVRGVLYKNVLKYLANGLGFTVLSIMALRYIVSLTSWVQDTELKALLTVLYALLFLGGFGFLQIMLGAKKLRKIEEV